MFNSHWNPIKHKPLCGCNAQRPSDNITKETRKTNAYNDNLFDRFAINHIASLDKRIEVKINASNQSTSVHTSSRTSVSLRSHLRSHLRSSLFVHPFAPRTPPATSSFSARTVVHTDHHLQLLPHLCSHHDE